MGDATNSVLILAGEMLKKAEQLLILGLHPSEIIKGYELASTKALAELESTSMSVQGLHILMSASSFRTVDVISPITPHEVVPRYRPEARNRVKTVWL